MERENYFFELSEEEHSDKTLVLIIYDIIDNKKRLKLAKFLQGYGVRVQKSAFEAKLTRKQYEKLLQKIPSYCTDEDTVRVYKIIGKSQVTAFGINEIRPEDDDVILI